MILMLLICGAEALTSVQRVAIGILEPLNCREMSECLGASEPEVDRIFGITSDRVRMFKFFPRLRSFEVFHLNLALRSAHEIQLPIICTVWPL